MLNFKETSRNFKLASESSKKPVGASQLIQFTIVIAAKEQEVWMKSLKMWRKISRNNECQNVKLVKLCIPKVRLVYVLTGQFWQLSVTSPQSFERQKSLESHFQSFERLFERYTGEKVLALFCLSLSSKLSKN